MVNFTLPSTTNEMISISTSQTFRSWVVIFHLRRPVAFLFLNLYDTTGLAPRMRVRRLSSRLLKQGYLVERLKSSFRKFYGRYGDLILAIWSLPLTNVKWHSGPWPTVTSQPIRLSTNLMTLNRVWPSTNYEWFPWSICNGCGMPAGNAYLSGHLVPSPFLGLACAPIVETRFLELAMSLLDLSRWIPLGTFSILLSHRWRPGDRFLLKYILKTKFVPDNSSE